MNTSNRYKNYLQNYEFYSNSVQFRIVSSKSLERFKNVQSYQLNQLANGLYYFDSNRREILLLKYDMWSRWLYEVENLFIELNNTKKVLDKDDMNLIISLAIKTSDKYTEIILHSNISHFNNVFSKIWIETHEKTFNFMLDMLKALKDFTFEIAFTQITNILIETLQYTLLEIFELDSLMCRTYTRCQDCTSDDCNDSKKNKNTNNIPFIIVSNFSNKIYNLTGNCPIKDRIGIYKKYFDFDTVYIKNYTHDCIDKHITESIESTGVLIDYKKTLVKI